MRLLIATTAALVTAASAAFAEPVKLTDRQLDAVVAGDVCYEGCIPETYVKANNGWGNGDDGTNKGSFHGKTAPSKLDIPFVPEFGKINMNATTSTGR